MKTGIELIAIERQEQIEKHGYTNQFTTDNPKYYDKYQLIIVARALMHSGGRLPTMDIIIEGGFADGWDEDRLMYMSNKPYKERLIIAGSLIAAEIDRLNFIGA